MEKKLNISIVTVCYNSEKTIEDTIKSVLTQSYKHIEYIIVDGLSKDNTLKIIEKYKDLISIVISEKDKGLYDAINKGIRLAKGEVVGIINSDDVLASQDVIAHVAKGFKENDCEALYGDLVYTDAGLDRIVRTWKSKPYQNGLFLKGWMPAHPTFYAKKELFEKLGYYNTSFKISADYELMLRFLHKHKSTVFYLNKTIVKMRTGGVSNSSFANRLHANKEDRKAWKLNNIKPNRFTFIIKPLSKIKQFLK